MPSSTRKIEKITNMCHPYWPSWFDLANYKCLESISSEQFIIELQERLRLLHCPTDSKGRRLTDDRKWRAITQGQVLLNYLPQAPKLGCEAIKELSGADIEALYQDFLVSDGSPIQPDYLFPSDGKGVALLAIDLANADNALLVSNFIHFINQARTTHQIAEPMLPRLSKTHIKSFKKLLFYKAIPYLDLMLHCHNAMPNDEHWQPLKFSYPVLAKLLLGDASEAELFKLKYQRFFKLFSGTPESDERLALLFAAIKQYPKILNTNVKAL